MRRPMALAVAASSMGTTKIRAISSQSGPATARTLGTSAGASQLVIAPSARVAASRTIPGRRAASTSPGGCAGGGSRRNPRTVNVSNSPLTFSPASAGRRNFSVSLARW